MNYLDLDLIKKHLNILDYCGDDDYLASLGEVVEVAVGNEIDDDLATIATKNGGKLPMPLIQAMLLLCGLFYSNRENIAFAASFNVPYTYQYLTDQYRRYGTGGDTTPSVIAEIAEKLAELQNKIDNIDGNEPITVERDGDITIGIEDINLGEY